MQNIDYWNSEESVRRYAKMKYKLFDIESKFISKALIILNKKPSQLKFLDLGCGGGRTTVPLKRIGFKVIGVDIAENLIRTLKKNFPDIDAKVGDAASLNFEDNTFDIVLFSHNSIDCLYPYKNRENAFKEINRVLKEGGIFIFSSHVFNFIPFSIPVFKNIIFNFKRWNKLLKSGYYREYMDDGNVVEIYSSSFSEIKKELNIHNFSLYKHSRVINKSSNFILTLLRSFLNWERYYLVIKDANKSR